MVLLLALAGGEVAQAQDAPAPVAPKPDAPKPEVKLPAGVVARVRGKDLSTDEFRVRLARAALDEVDDPRSGPAGVFRILIEEMVVLQEAERLGIKVTNEDYGRRYDELDHQVRDKSRGAQTLRDIMTIQKMSPEDFRARLEDQIRKERIAADPSYLGASLAKEESARFNQIEFVIAEILKKTKVDREKLPSGVVAKVNGQPLTEAAFGRVLQSRLSESEVRRHLNEECLSMLLDQESLDFTEAQVSEALELDRPLYERMKAEAVSPERQALSFEDFLQLRYGAPVAELRASRYRRGLFALRQRIWKSLDEDKVRAAWVAGSQGEYGPSLLVTDIQISFEIPKAVVQTVKRRTEAEAVRLANDFLRRIRGGETAEAIVKEIKALKDRSLVADRRSLIQRDNDLLLYSAAAALPDGGWSDPVSTISEIHLLRRERLRPAPAYEEIREAVRQNVVDQKAQEWLQDMMRTQVTMAR